MKIKEILELSFTVKMNEIAKDHLSIGEKRLRSILKDIGCTHQVGKRGWIYIGDDQQILEKSIYDFAQPTATNKKYSQQPNKTENHDNIKTVSNPTNKPIKKESTQKRKKVTYEIEEQLHDELKIRSIREKRNVSDIVNELIKKGLN